MLRPKEECINCKAFAALILDYEFDGSDGLPAYVSCRILVEDLKRGEIIAASRQEAIEKFRRGDY